MINYANVNLWGQWIGVVSWDDLRQKADFEYTPEFLQSGLDISPLKMRPEKDRVYSFPDLNFGTFKGLPGMLADSLPDKFGNALINGWLARRGRDPDTCNPVERLLYQGKRGMGALEFEPAKRGISDISTKIELGGLVEAAKLALSDQEKLNVRLKGKESNLLQMVKVGTSAGGARAKAVIAYNEKTGKVMSGQLDAPKGFSHWLIKLDGVDGESKHYGRVEYAYYKMATTCGIEMTECRLEENGGLAHFMTKRFDRIDGDEKLHVQTLCGLAHFDFNMPGAYSYEQLFQTTLTLRLPARDAEQVYRRMVFNIVARNQDDHTKNFSFLMDKKGRWTLSPAYDVTYCRNPLGQYTSQHQMSVNDKLDHFTKEDLLIVARSMNIKKPAEILEEVVESVSKWPSVAKTCGVPDSKIKAIAAVHLLRW